MAVTRVQGGMRIAVIGKGNIGGSLGGKWRAAGHDVVYGARDGFLGDATATTTVDGLLPLWFALVQQNGGNRRVALRIVAEG
jgi:predicted dinucleotide-binding enzyme